MRPLALLMTIVLVCLALAPALPLCSPAADAAPLLKTLDVCHASSDGMGFDLPCLACCPAAPLPLQPDGTGPGPAAPAAPVLLAFTDEHPPKPIL